MQWVTTHIEGVTQATLITMIAGIVLGILWLDRYERK